jgi:hypothetical protein
VDAAGAAGAAELAGAVVDAGLAGADAAGLAGADAAGFEVTGDGFGVVVT